MASRSNMDSTNDGEKSKLSHGAEEISEKPIFVGVMSDVKPSFDGDKSDEKQSCDGEKLFDKSFGTRNGTTNSTDENISNSYKIKWINFEGAMYAVVTQNENGPCPLLAIANVLLLRGQISIRKEAKSVREEELLQLIVDCILRLQPEDLRESDKVNYERNLSDVLSLVPSLSEGLDVNVYFTAVSQFEYTTACALFDLLDITMVHGWIVDPQETELLALVNGLGYNQLVERIVASTEGDTTATILKHFLDTSATQLTYAGLCELSASLKDGDLVVLFRNNHFHTLHKHKESLFVLVTDQGFLNEPSMVWETLEDVDGNSSFVNSSFGTGNTSEETDETSDYLLALSMQDEENAKNATPSASNSSQSEAKEEPKAAASCSTDSQREVHAQRPSSSFPASTPSKRPDKLCSVM